MAWIGRFNRITGIALDFHIFLILKKSPVCGKCTMLIPLMLFLGGYLVAHFGEDVFKLITVEFFTLESSMKGLLMTSLGFSVLLFTLILIPLAIIAEREIEVFDAQQEALAATRGGRDSIKNSGNNSSSSNNINAAAADHHVMTAAEAAGAKQSPTMMSSSSNNKGNRPRWETRRRRRNGNISRDSFDATRYYQG